MTKSNDEMVFSHLVARFGGPLKNYEAYLPGISGYQMLLADWHIESHSSNEGLLVFADALYIDLVDNRSFNAFATCIDEQEFVGVFAGAVDFLFRCFLSFMSDPDSLPEVGAASGEKGGTILWSDLNPGAEPNMSLIPRDTKRRDAAVLLALHAAHFLVHHELTHLVRGHIDLLNKEFSLKEFLEIPALPLTMNEARTRRALELDADHGAATLRLKSFQEASSSGYLQHLEVLGPDMAWALCLTMVFHIMWAQDAVNRRDEARTHPSPLTRWQSIMFSAETGEMLFPKELNRELLLKGFSQVHRWWKANSLPLVETDAVEDVLPELQALRADLGTLSPRIVEFASQRTKILKKRFGSGPK